ncbi:hypothetical protein OG316_04485 [Streptomyces sp. NBC_01022]|nr:hypothetical protein OG316_04485 [Streptomyces sp. NBC_01022]
MPNDLPPKRATYYSFAAWRDDGTDRQIHELLRCRVREGNRGLEDSTLVIPETWSVRAATGVPAVTTGKDAAKRVPGRELSRHSLPNSTNPASVRVSSTAGQWACDPHRT